MIDIHDCADEAEGILIYRVILNKSEKFYMILCRKLKKVLHTNIYPPVLSEELHSSKRESEN